MFSSPVYQLSIYLSWWSSFKFFTIFSNEKSPLPVDLNTALSLLARPASALPTSFPHFSPFPFPDPSTLFAFSQLRSNLPNYQTATIISPLLSATVTTTSAISASNLGPSPIKRPNREQQSASSPPSCSSSSVTSSCSPQQSPHRKQAAPVPDDKKVSSLKIFK